MVGWHTNFLKELKHTQKYVQDTTNNAGERKTKETIQTAWFAWALGVNPWWDF